MAARAGVRDAAGEDHGVAGGDPLEAARRAAVERRWRDVHEALSALDRDVALAVEDLELLATAAFLCSHREECRQARLRAYQLCLHRGDVRRAARCAAWIGLEQLSVGELAEATGCLPVSMSACSAWAAQAASLLEGQPDGPEQGGLLVPLAYERLVMQRDPAGAADVAAQAVAIGRRFEDPDLLALALTVQGRAMVRSARLPAGFSLLDESVSLVVAGEVSPAVAGLALTAAVDAADEAVELGRSEEWTRALDRWCDRQHGMVTFRCRSLAHQAALHRRQGRWREALEVAERAGAPSLAELDETAAAAARYQQAEVLRLRGELAPARTAYRQAGELGLDPQPGLALVDLAEGEIPAAAAALHRALGEARDGLDRVRLLPARVEVLLAAGERAAAADAAAELEQLAGDHPTPALEAAARQAGAGVRLADGDAPAALAAARRARRVWRHFGLPYEEAQARVLVARACRMLGDEATAVLELDAACDRLARLGARPALDAARTLRGRPADATPHGLTPREREVLALVSTGMTNRAIAEQLHVTTRTVDTHVGRILTKLGVATRAAATAFAHRHDLV